MFFHEEYGYRQNIIFDELLALLVLCALKKGQHPKGDSWIWGATCLWESFSRWIRVNRVNVTIQNNMSS